MLDTWLHMTRDSHISSLQTDRVVHLDLSEADQKEYAEMEQQTRSEYLKIKARTSRIGREALKLNRLLIPLRVACAGGNPPLVNNEHEKQSTSLKSDDDDRNNSAAAQKNRTVQYSDYAFTSKLKLLVQELKNVREKDPTGTCFRRTAFHLIPHTHLRLPAKSLVFSQYGSTLDWLKKCFLLMGFSIALYPVI